MFGMAQPGIERDLTSDEHQVIHLKASIFSPSQ